MTEKTSLMMFSVNGEVQPRFGRHALAFLQDINDTLEQRDADLAALAVIRASDMTPHSLY